MSVAVAALLLGIAVSGALTPAVARITRVQALPVPDRWARRATPTTGGLALVVAFVVAIQPAVVSGDLRSSSLPLVLGATAAFLLGLWDDAANLSPRLKLGGQVAIAAVAAAGGLRPDYLPAAIGGPLAVIVLVAGVNSVNLLDHVDGLAAGTTAIAAAGLAIIEVVRPGGESPAIAAALCGAALGYLPWNYRLRRPAIVFMGDSGSHLLGFALAGLSLTASPRGAGGVSVAVLAPLLAMAVPILDTTLVTVVRIAEGRPVWQGGRDHSSHRLVYAGFGERSAVGLLLGIAAACGGAAVIVGTEGTPVLSALVVGVAFAFLVFFGTRLAAIREGEGGSVLPLTRRPEAAEVPPDASAR
jgi:UDP-GlcNAc:undecaprenyl-phosphate GlcNAc-1-phosphate transferase